MFCLLYIFVLLSGKNQRERNRKKARRYPGRGFGLSEASEEGYYLHLPQAWLGPVPLVPDTKSKK